MRSFLSLARVWLDHGDVDRGWWSDGLHWTCLAFQQFQRYRDRYVRRRYGVAVPLSSLRSRLWLRLGR
jgi:hypothetical protein